MWAKDREISILRPLINYQHRVAMVTVSAPGADYLPWSCESDHGRHSGTIGCRVEPSKAEVWNASAPWRWAAMWKAFSNEHRWTGPTVLAKAWEPQKRGVAHLHLVVPIERHREVVEWLKAHAGDYGFGFVDDARGFKAGAPGAVAGAYIASYLGDGGKVDAVVDAVMEGVIPSRTFYVNPVISNGCTMRALRLKRRAFAVMYHGAPHPMWATVEDWGNALVAVGWTASRDGPPNV